MSQVLAVLIRAVVMIVTTPYYFFMGRPVNVPQPVPLPVPVPTPPARARDVYDDEIEDIMSKPVLERAHYVWGRWGTSGRTGMASSPLFWHLTPDGKPGWQDQDYVYGCPTQIKGSSCHIAYTPELTEKVHNHPLIPTSIRLNMAQADSAQQRRILEAFADIQREADRTFRTKAPAA